MRNLGAAFGTVALLVATLTTCGGNRASGPYFQDIIHPNLDDAIVYFYRDARPESPQSPDWIYAFDKIMRLDPGGYTFEIIPPGRYMISLRSKATAEDLFFDLGPAQTVFLKWGFVLRGDGYESKLAAVDETQALKELRNCRLMQLDPGGRP